MYRCECKNHNYSLSRSQIHISKWVINVLSLICNAYVVKSTIYKKLIVC